MRETSFDIAVIGGGPGGYVAAIRAAQLGLKPVVIEREQLGGICLNWGCIPTKALLRTAELYHLMGRASEFGLAADNLRYDLARIVERSRKAAARLSDGVAYLMQKNKITVVDGTARLQGQGRIAVTDRDGQPLPEIEAKHIIVATGARARTSPGLEPDGKVVWTYKEAMVPRSFPKSLLVVGSGAIGIEFAESLPDTRRRGDRGGDTRPHAALRGHGNLFARAQGLRQAGDDHPHKDRSGTFRAPRRQRHGDPETA